MTCSKFGQMHWFRGNKWESAPFLTEKMAVVLELALEQQVSAASVIAWLAKKENEVNE